MAKIIQIRDNIVSVQGSEKFKLFQFFDFGNENTGFVLSAKGNEAKVLIIGSTAQLKINQVGKPVKEQVINAYQGYFGKVINPFGEIIYSEKGDKTKGAVIGFSTLFNAAPSVLDRHPINKPLDTGMIAIDTMIPIGRGQRELIIGDRVTGKSTIAINTIINNAETKDEIVSIYVAIGQKKASVNSTYEVLKKYKALKNTIIIYANPDSAAEQFLAPMVGMAIAEAISYKGKDVLVILDDLSKHANVYREISLSIDRNPGREAYPNDIFYMHSRLLERGGRFSDKFNNGSITILPIVETVEEDIASLIPSNIISITDGQIFTNFDKFNKGAYPAIDIQMSVSRTGSAVQSPLIRHVSKSLRADHAKFEEIKKFADVSIDLNDRLNDMIKKSNQLDKVVQQFGHIGYSREIIAFLVLLYNAGELEGEFQMRDLALVIRSFFERDPIGQGLKKHLQKVTSKDAEQWISSHAKLVLVDLVAGLKGEFGKVISKTEWEMLMKGVE